jgi:cullin 1
VNREFDGHALFQKALKDAFSEFVNADIGKVKSAECISTFCDRLLKTGGEKMSEQETEEYLEKAVQLFAYLQDKDLFAEIYRNQLAKRLLNQRSESDDMERTMIGKLKMKCGAQFTSKMEGMLNDLAVGVDHQTEFNTFCRDLVVEGGASSAVAVARESDGSSPLDFAVQVLTQGYWPTYRMVECRLPAAMDRCLQTFARFYESTQSGRKLQWVHSLGSAEVKATYPKKAYQIQLVTLQAVVLMEFSADAEPRSFDSLCNDLNINEDVMKRVLHSLSCAKFKILTRISNDSEEAAVGGGGGPAEKKKDSGIKSTDSFVVNDNFQYTMRKFRVPMASLEESHNPKRVEEDRSYVIEACIVRIMKVRVYVIIIQFYQLILISLSSLRRPERHYHISSWSARYLVKCLSSNRTVRLSRSE